MDDAAERDAGLTWEAYLPGLFDQPAPAEPSPPSSARTAQPPVAETAPQQPRSSIDIPTTPPKNRAPRAPAPTAVAYPPPVASSRFVARNAGRTSLSPIGALTMGIAIFLAFLIFIVLLP